MEKQRVFCVIGRAYSERQQILKKIKAKVLSGKSNPLNTDTLYPRHLDPEKLKSELSHFSFEGKRLIIFKDAASLSSQCKAVLLKELKEKRTSNYFVFEIERNPSECMRDKKIAQNSFFRYLFAHSAILKNHSAVEDITFFQLFAAVRRHQAAKALYILEKLFLEFKNDRTLSMQIIGALVRYISSLPGARQKDKYLTHLWRADRLIKEKGIDPKLALEVVFTEMLTA